MTIMKHPFISISLVTLQFALIALLLLLVSVSLNIVVLTAQGLAILIGLWAVQAMHLGHFNIVPDPKPDAQLVTRGPYQFIRHPMYLSILLFFIPLIILNLNWLNLAVYGALAITLFIKLTYEERLLAEKLADYSDYQKVTKKLIPFVL